MFDVVAIGAGTAGLVTVAGCAGLGAKAGLIERDRLGGDCLWTGCVPSKALISSARVAHHFKEASAFGLPSSAPGIDGADVLASVRDVRAQIAPHDDPERFRAMGVDVIEGSARFVSPHEVEVGDRRIRARRFVVATGSLPVMPSVPGLADLPCLTEDSVFELAKRPDRLIVLGDTGAAVELAQAMRALGSEVALIARGGLLPEEDTEAVGVLRRALLGG